MPTNQRLFVKPIGPIMTFAMHLLRLLTLAITLMACVAHADEYQEVSQLIRAGKLPEAAAKADQHLAAKPKDPQMRFLKGVIQRDSGKTMDSISTFIRLTEDYPELPEPYNNLAVLYAGQNQFDKARSALEMAIRTNPSYATAHENLGDVYAKLASQAYEKALQLDAANSAVAPKLALIRELFSHSSPQNSRISTPSSAAPIAPTVSAPPVAPTSIPAPVLAKPQPTSLAPVTPTTTAQEPLVPSQAAPSANRSQWEEERRLRIVYKTKIGVTLKNLVVTVNGNKAVAKFKQDYEADGLKVISLKTLELVKHSEHWQMVKESTGA
jgi:tetratricopeptide (TPR) repeat protein